jgi:hypothetical protein
MQPNCESSRALNLDLVTWLPLEITTKSMLPGPYFGVNAGDEKT